MIGIDAMVNLIVWLIFVGAVFGLLWWLIGFVGIPEPFNKAARVVLAVFAVLLLISLLLSFVGHPVVDFQR